MYCSKNPPKNRDSGSLTISFHMTMPMLGMPFSGGPHPIGATHVANLYLFMLSKLKLTKISFKNKSVAKQLMSPVDQPQIRETHGALVDFSL